MVTVWWRRFYIWALGLPGYWVLAPILAILSSLTLIADWVVLPLNGALYPTALKLSFAGFSIPFHAVFIITLVLAILISKKYSLLSFFLIWTHIFCILSIPINILLSQHGVVSSYLEQSKVRLGIAKFTKDYFPLNVNLQPLFEPIVAIDNNWDQLVIAVSMLDTSWFISLLMAFFIVLMFINNGSKGLYYCFVSGSSLLVLLAISDVKKIDNFITVNDNINKIAAFNHADDPKSAIILCQRTLADNSAMAYSESMMTQCLSATLKLYGNLHPLFAYSGLIWKQGAAGAKTTFSSEPIALYTYKKLLENNSILKSTLTSKLDGELIAWLNRTGEQSVLSAVSKAIADDKMSYAAHQLNIIDDSNLLKNYYSAYIDYKIRNYNRSAVNFKVLASKIQFPPIKANMLCGLGDTYTISGDYLAARQIYISCKDLDSVSIFSTSSAISAGFQFDRT